MAKKSAPKTAEPETSPKAAISQAEAVRQALAAGMESPADGTGFLKSTFGIDMTPQTWSSYKAQEKARQAKRAAGGTKGKPGRKAHLAPASVSEMTTISKASTKPDGELLAALTAIKPLIAQYGAEQVKKMVDLLG